VLSGRLELNGTHQHQVYADGFNVSSENMNAIKKNTEALLEANMKVCLEENTRRNNYMIMSGHQTARQNHNLLTVINPLKM